MLEDMCVICMTRATAHKNYSFPSNQLCYFQIKQPKPKIFLLASRNLDEINFNLP